MKLLLSKLQWFSRGDLWVTGSILIDGRFPGGEELLNYFSGTATLCEFEAAVLNANGRFSVIRQNRDQVWIAVDRLRQNPIFYTSINGELVIGDDCYVLAGMMTEIKFDHEAVTSFLASGYVIGKKTLIKGIFQAEAGSIVILGAEPGISYYHNPAGKKSDSTVGINMAGELEGLLDSTFKKYFNALKDRFIVIPLSGGYDSRLVALMAKKYHPGNVLCYTYGIKDNREIAIAREAALRLGLKWINIVYDSELINDFMDDGFFDTYYPWVSNLTSMFFLQEYFSVRYLRSNGLIPENSVFIPGFSGDFIAGSNLIPGMNAKLDKREISKIIFREYFRFVHPGKKESDALCRIIADGIPGDRQEAWKIIESWVLKERHSKFIVNSAKVFTYFGYDYILPLWDNDLVDFMLSRPFTLRMDRKLYEQTLRDNLFRESGLNMQNETNPSPVKKRFQRSKEFIKPIVPSFIRDRFFNMKSPIFYDEITRILTEDINNQIIMKPAQPNFYNSYIIQWYLVKTAEKLNSGVIR